jgi:adenine deaminase
MCMVFLSVTAIPDYAVPDIGLFDRVSLGVISPMPGALAGTR